MNDPDLLRRFAETGDELAFAELVSRRVGLVYAAALRQVGGDAHRAEDVTQEVFLQLARKARALARHPALIGWLYTSTHFAAAKLVRGERRRATREKEAHAMHDHPATNDNEWARVRPVLDAAMHELDELDRQSVLLRFFDQQPFSRIGAQLGLSENAAQKRVERALERLHAALSRRGVTSTAAALGIVLAHQAHASAAPAGLASSVTGTALAGAAGAGAGAGAAGWLAAWTTGKLAAGVAGVVVLAAAAFVTVERIQNHKTTSQLAAANEERHALRAEQRTLQELAQRAEQRASEAERDNGELLRAVEEFRKQEAARTRRAGAPPGAADAARGAEDERLVAEREYQQRLAKVRAQQAIARAKVEQDFGVLTPEQRFEQRIAAVRQLVERAEFRAAIRLFNDAMFEKPTQLPVSDEVRGLQETLQAQNGMVTLTLESDQQTWVSITDALSPRKFLRTTVTLAPGNYEVVGRRKGFREVRIPIAIRMGVPPPTLAVACTVSAEN